MPRASYVVDILDRSVEEEEEVETAAASGRGDLALNLERNACQGLDRTFLAMRDEGIPVNAFL